MPGLKSVTPPPLRGLTMPGGSRQCREGSPDMWR